jgi:hypothetical protein
LYDDRGAIAPRNNSPGQVERDPRVDPLHAKRRVLVNNQIAMLGIVPRELDDPAFRLFEDVLGAESDRSRRSAVARIFLGEAHRATMSRHKPVQIR